MELPYLVIFRLESFFFSVSFSTKKKIIIKIMM